MHASNNHSPPCRPRAGRDAGNTLVLVLIVIAVLSLVAANLMWSATERYHVTYQSASWQEALVAAEAGVDLAMAELRKRVVDPSTAFPEGTKGPWVSGVNSTANPSKPDLRPYLGSAVDPTLLGGQNTNPGLSPFPDNGHALPLTPVPNHGGEGNTSMAVRVYVDAPDSNAVSDNTLAPTLLGVVLAQLPPGARPSLPALPFINQPNSGAGDTDSRGRAVNSSRWWWRIRAVGCAGVSGPARPSPDYRDNKLRRFSFLTDWRNGRLATLPVGGATVSAPQVTRAVEVLARPHSRVQYAMFADKQIDLDNHTVRVDSYDSSKGDYADLTGLPSSTASGPGYTAPGNAVTPYGTVNLYAGRDVGWLGNIATNGQILNAGNADVQGNVMTNSGQTTPVQNLTGTQDPNFYQELTPVEPIDWSNPPDEWLNVPNTNTITDNYTIQASADAAHPAHLRVNGINLTGQSARVLNVIAPPRRLDGTTPPGYIKIYVSGDMRTAGSNAIALNENVTAVISFTGSVSLDGVGIDNQSNLANHLFLNGVMPTDGIAGGDAHRISITPASQGTPKTKKGKHEDDVAIDLATGQVQARVPIGYAGDFNGIIYAPHHDLTLGGNQSGGLLGTGLNVGSLPGTNLLNPVFDYCGAFVANKILVSVNSQVHYDETLRYTGQLGGYRIVNWFEDTASRAP